MYSFEGGEEEVDLKDANSASDESSNVGPVNEKSQWDDLYTKLKGNTNLQSLSSR